MSRWCSCTPPPATTATTTWWCRNSSKRGTASTQSTGRAVGDSVATDPMSAVAYAEALPEVLASLGSEPVVVVGNSVGGFAAVLAAARHPQRIRALVLVNPGGFTPRWFGSSAGCRLIGRPRLARVFLRLLPLLYLRTRSDAVRATRRRASRLRFDPDGRRVFGELWRSLADPRREAREAARAVTAPTLLVWGARDPILPRPDAAPGSSTGVVRRRHCRTHTSSGCRAATRHSSSGRPSSPLPWSISCPISSGDRNPRRPTAQA
ncbi:MAG: alpha/beta fold hydrolase [Dermatophilaceae bacterium]